MTPTIPFLLDGYTDLPPGKIANVVLYLEMVSRPAALKLPLPPLSVEQVERPNPDWYRNLFRKVGENWLWTSVLMASDDELRQRLADPLVELYRFSQGAEVLGVAELDRRVPGEVEIVIFGLVPEATGKRLGGAFMSALLDQAFQSGTRRVWLHTCTFDDPRAVPFYLKAGFTPFKWAVELMDDPRILGVLPETAAPHIPTIRR